MATGSRPPDPDINWVQIKDFSPGIFQYSLGNLPLTYSTEFPLGSASYAIRCYNKPGVGLCPFASYSQPQNLLPFQAGTNNDVIYSVGLQAANPDLTFYAAQDGISAPYEMLFMAVVNVSNSTTYTAVYWSTGSLEDMSSDLLYTAPEVLQTISGFARISFTRARSTYGTDGFILSPQVWWTGGGNGLGLGVFAAPDWENSLPLLKVSTIEGSFLHEHSDRVLVFAQVNNLSYTLNGAWNGIPFPSTPINIVTSAFEEAYFTDPPDSITFNTTPNTYSTEGYSGYGAWGSMSTGELLLVKSGGGAVVVSGDPGFPSSDIFLPGVKGTGAVWGKAVTCQAGLAYVTESDGVYVWNGGNTASKISSPIPDEACIRTELLSNFSASEDQESWGPVAFNDNLGNYCFFANNWVYDSLNNSWWQCEDPNILSFGTFSHSSAQSDRYMWALPSRIISNTSLSGPQMVLPYLFDIKTMWNNYTWISNPIPAGGTGALATLTDVEIVVSNPTTTPATVRITPTVPPGQVHFNQQNQFQSALAIIPAETIAYRASYPFGYTDYNIEIKLEAANVGTQAAPIIHELNVGFKAIRTSDVGATQSTLQTSYWLMDDPVYGLIDQTTVVV